MEFLWLLGAFVAGVLVTWIYLGLRHKKLIAEREADLQRKTIEAEKALDAENKEHQKTRASLTKTQAKEASANEHAASLQSGLEKSDGKLKKARSEQRKTKRLLTKAEAAAATADERITSLETDISGAGDKLQNERNEHKNTRQLLAELKSSEAGAAARRDALETELEKLRSASEISKAADAERNDRVKQLQSENRELGAQVKSTEEAHAKAQSGLAGLEEQAKQARVQNADLQQSLKQQEAELKRLETELAQVERKTGEPAAAGAASPAAAPAQPVSAAADDLSRINGIGEAVQEKLAGLGITSFRQIAEFTPADINRVNEVLSFPGRIERERWVEQARAIVSAVDEG